ncbi:MAG TPA: GLUG motif-containing protein [Candidatus Acidoferrales bacterium]|nr:GLUG motif-containing protein [Candidatus Acidoferrales bacterium]
MKTKSYTIIKVTIFFLLNTTITFSQTAVAPSGSGASGDPYQIDSLANLYWITQNSGSWDSYFRQTSNIDASSSSGWDSGQGFSTIGNSVTLFGGTYDGDGHTISGLYISRSGTSGIGMFGFVQGATIKNLGLAGENITGANYVGSLVGYTHNSTEISNSHSAGIVNGDGYAGGLVGYNENSTVSESYSTASVSGVDGVGGLVGGNHSAAVSNSYAAGSVSGSNTGSSDVGGLVGDNILSTISNSYSTGSVSGSDQRAGGLVGYNATSTVSNSYSTGSVSGGSFIGGLIGFGFTSTVNSSFWDTQTSGQSTDGTNAGGGTGETTLDMKLQSTFSDSGWDFTTPVWAISSGINNGYPYLVSVTDISLAVQATGFLATTDMNSVTLSWKTQSEVDNAGFNVLREDPGSSFLKPISNYIDNTALRGLGTMSTGRAYSFIDDHVASGSTYRYEIQSVSTHATTEDLFALSVTVGVPSEYALYQNYPNPFNPSTTIRFDLKEQSNVTLDVYNVLGQSVFEDNYGNMNAGRYNEAVNMERFASGVYFYRITAVGDDGQKFVSIKKLELMK